MKPWMISTVRLRFVLLAAAFPMTGSGATPLREEVDPAILGSWPAYRGELPDSVAVHRGIAYVGAGGIQYVDVRNPTRPEVFGGFPARGFSRGGIVVSREHLYSCQSGRELVILELRSSGEPVLVGSFRCDARTVAVEGDLACVGTLNSVLFLDTSVPARPRLIGEWKESSSQPDLALSGRYVFVADTIAGLRILDGKAEGGPREVGRVPSGSELFGAVGVAVVGGSAFVAEWDAGLQILDVSEPTRPLKRGRFKTRGPAVRVTVSGGYAYVSQRDIGVEIVDVRNLDHPTKVGDFDTPDDAYGVSVEGSVACVADMRGGLQIFDVSRPQLPVRTGSVDTRRYAAGIAYSAPYAFLATDDLGLEVIDVTRPDRPLKVAGCEEARDATAVVLSADRRRAFVGTGEEGVHVVDISNPLRPVRTTGWSVPGYGQGIRRAGSNVVVAIRTRGFQLVDVSDADRPRILHDGFPEGTTQWAVDVGFVGNHVYVADQPRGILVYDVSTPTQPVQVGLLGMPGVNRIGVGVGMVYATADEGLLTLDVSSPASPKVVDTIPVRFGFPAFDILAAGDTLAVAGFPGLRLYDVRDATHPVLFGMAHFGQASGVAHDGRQFLVSEFYGGIRIVDPHRPAEMALRGREPGLSGFAGFNVVADRLAVVLDGEFRLRVAGLSTSGGIQDLGVLKSEAQTEVALFQGGHLHTFGGFSFATHDMSDPRAPRLASSTNLYSYRADMHIDGNTLYLLAAGTPPHPSWPEPEGLVVFDVSDPARPVRRGQFKPGGPPNAVAVTNGFGYLAHGLQGLTVLDVSKPEAIRVAGTTEVVGDAIDVVMAKSCAFVVTRSDGIQIFDVGKPVEPRLLASIATEEGTPSLAIHGDVAFIGSGDIQVYDISNPAQPRRRGGYTSMRMPGFTSNSLTPEGDLLTTTLQEGTSLLRLRPRFDFWAEEDGGLRLDWEPTPGLRLERNTTGLQGDWEDLGPAPESGTSRVSLREPTSRFRLVRP